MRRYVAHRCVAPFRAGPHTAAVPGDFGGKNAHGERGGTACRHGRPRAQRGAGSVAMPGARGIERRPRPRQLYLEWKALLLEVWALSSLQWWFASFLLHTRDETLAARAAAAADASPAVRVAGAELGAGTVARGSLPACLCTCMRAQAPLRRWLPVCVDGGGRARGAGAAARAPRNVRHARCRANGRRPHSTRALLLLPAIRSTRLRAEEAACAAQLRRAERLALATERAVKRGQEVCAAAASARRSH